MGKCKNIKDCWLKEFDWFCEKKLKVKNVDEVGGFCNVCSKPVNIERGKQALTQHENSATHKAMIRVKSSGQMRFEGSKNVSNLIILRKVINE